MSWSTSKHRDPRVANGAEAAGELCCSRRCRARRPARPCTASEVVRQVARAAPTSLRCPALSSFGHPPSELGDAEHVEGVGDVGPGGAERGGRGRRGTRRSLWRSAATRRLSSTVRSSNSSSDCHVRPSPARARWCGASDSMSRPSKRTRPAIGTNPVSPSMNVVLPAPLGPISPTICPSATSRSTPSTARSPPNVTVNAWVSSSAVT